MSLSGYKPRLKLDASLSHQITTNCIYCYFLISLKCSFEAWSESITQGSLALAKTMQNLLFSPFIPTHLSGNGDKNYFSDEDI